MKPYVTHPIAEYSDKRKQQRTTPPFVILPGIPSSCCPRNVQHSDNEEAIESSEGDLFDDPPQHFGTYGVSVLVPPSREMPLDEALRYMGIGTDVLVNASMPWLFLVIPFVAQWLFWIGFAGLFGDR